MENFSSEKICDFEWIDSIIMTVNIGD